MSEIKGGQLRGLLTIPPRLRAADPTGVNEPPTKEPKKTAGGGKGSDSHLVCPKCGDTTTHIETFMCKCSELTESEMRLTMVLSHICHFVDSGSDCHILLYKLCNKYS